MDPQDELRVYLHDLLTDTWTSVSVAEWMDQYEDRVATALTMHADTFGGTFSLTGTSERGRVSVFTAAPHRTVLDLAWHALTRSEALQYAKKQSAS